MSDAHDAALSRPSRARRGRSRRCQDSIETDTGAVLAVVAAGRVPRRMRRSPRARAEAFAAGRAEGLRETEALRARLRRVIGALEAARAPPRISAGAAEPIADAAATIVEAWSSVRRRNELFAPIVRAGWGAPAAEGDRAGPPRRCRRDDELRSARPDRSSDPQLAARRYPHPRRRARYRPTTGASACPSADDLARGVGMNDWPPKPGSTVITMTMSSRLAYGSRADSGVSGLTARPGARPAARIRRRVGSIWVRVDLDVERDDRSRHRGTRP